MYLYTMGSKTISEYISVKFFLFNSIYYKRFITQEFIVQEMSFVLFI